MKVKEMKGSFKKPKFSNWRAGVTDELPLRKKRRGAGCECGLTMCSELGPLECLIFEKHWIRVLPELLLQEDDGALQALHVLLQLCHEVVHLGNCTLLERPLVLNADGITLIKIYSHF